MLRHEGWGTGGPLDPKKGVLLLISLFNVTLQSLWILCPKWVWQASAL